MKKNTQDYRDFLDKLVWERLKRDIEFRYWAKDQTKQDLKNKLEEKYSISIHTDPQFHFYYHPSAVTFLDSDDLNPDNQNLYSPFREIILKIDVSKINPVTGITSVLKEIKQGIEAKIEMRKNVITKDTRINEETEELENLKDLHTSDYTRKPHDFDRDLRLFVQYEEGKVKSPTSRERKTLDKIHNLLYGMSLAEGKKNPEIYGGIPCGKCKERNKCFISMSSGASKKKYCEKMERLLRPGTSSGRNGLNIQKNRDEWVFDEEAVSQYWDKEREEKEENSFPI